MDEEQDTQQLSENEESEQTKKLPKARGGEERLSTPAWVLLLVGAAILDLFQAGIAIGTLGTFGTIVNILIDINVGLSLALFFYYKNMLDWKVGISVILGFASDFITIGIAPSWLLDILYVWMVTDGSKMMSMAPVIGEAAQKAALTIMSKGKNPAQQAELASRSENLVSKNRSYMAQRWGMGGKEGATQQTLENTRPTEEIGKNKTNDLRTNTVNTQGNQTTPNREKTSLKDVQNTNPNDQNSLEQSQPETENNDTSEDNQDSNSVDREAKEPENTDENTGERNPYNPSDRADKNQEIPRNQRINEKGRPGIEAEIKIFGNLRVKEAKAQFGNGATKTVRPSKPAKDLEFSYNIPTENQETQTANENAQQETNSVTK